MRNRVKNWRARGTGPIDFYVMLNNNAVGAFVVHSRKEIPRPPIGSSEIELSRTHFVVSQASDELYYLVISPSNLVGDKTAKVFVRAVQGGEAQDCQDGDGTYLRPGSQLGEGTFEIGDVVGGTSEVFPFMVRP